MSTAQYLKDLEAANKQYEDQLRKQQLAAEEQIRLQTNAEKQLLNQESAEAKKTFEEQAQAAYLQRMMAQKMLTEALAYQGYNGGLTESAYIQLANQYGQAYTQASKLLSQEQNEISGKLQSLLHKKSAQLLSSRQSYEKKYADLAFAYQKERARLLEQERAAQLKAAAEAAKKQSSSSSSSNKTSSKPSSNTNTSSSNASSGYNPSKNNSNKGGGGPTIRYELK